MDKNLGRKTIYVFGIGLGIVLISAFISSQLIFPLLFGRPRSVEVPELVGKSLSKARRELTELGLHTVVKDSVWSEEAKVEEVIEQHPEPGKKLKPEGSVYLVVCRGSRIVSVPSLNGKTYSEAYVSLRGSDLRARVADSLYSNSYPVNTVVRSSPSAGTKVEKESTIKLYLSRGPEPADSTETAGEDYIYPY
jgi:serine/threonine-protein kinase